MTLTRVFYALSFGSFCSVLLAEAFVVTQQYGTRSVHAFSNVNSIYTSATSNDHVVASLVRGLGSETFLTARKRRTQRKETTEGESNNAEAPLSKPKKVEPAAPPVVEQTVEEEDEDELEDDEEYYYEEDEDEDEEPRPPVISRGDDPVSLQVQDIRTLVGGAAVPSRASESRTTSSTSSSFIPDQTSVLSAFGGIKGDSMDQLLADAKRMQLEEKNKGVNEGEGEGELSIPSIAKNVISTIVTADFFVVCALLLWFLTGIFCSYVLENDSIQIAFNGIFEPVVQPALGVLMIGTIAGAVFKDEEEETM